MITYKKQIEEAGLNSKYIEEQAAAIIKEMTKYADGGFDPVYVQGKAKRIVEFIEDTCFNQD